MADEERLGIKRVPHELSAVLLAVAAPAVRPESSTALNAAARRDDNSSMSMSVEPGPLPKPLDKWIVLPGEAGTIQLTRTAWSRGGNALGYLVAFALFAGLTVMSLLRADRPIPLEGGGSMPGWTFVV